MSLYGKPSASLSTLLLCSLLAGACSKPVPPEKPSVSTTTFFDWCQNEKFALRLSNDVMVNSRPTKVSSGELGFIKYRAWIPCKTEQEAQKFLETTFAELKRTAGEKGCECQGIEPHLTGLSMKYRSGRNDGVLVGRCVLDDTPGTGKTDKAYFVELKLTESVP
jgi:hypothetical protein